MNETLQTSNIYGYSQTYAQDYFINIINWKKNHEKHSILYLYLKRIHENKRAQRHLSSTLWIKNRNTKVKTFIDKLDEKKNFSKLLCLNNKIKPKVMITMMKKIYYMQELFSKSNTTSCPLPNLYKCIKFFLYGKVNVLEVWTQGCT